MLLRDVVLRELGQLDQLRHDLLLLVRVRQVHQQGDDAVGNILLSNNDHNIFDGYVNQDSLSLMSPIHPQTCNDQCDSIYMSIVCQ